MSQVQLIKLTNKKTGSVYYSRKNKKLVTQKIKLRKYDPKTRKHEVFEEAKK
jgi:large subunit ribosomal protein L33